MKKRSMLLTIAALLLLSPMAFCQEQSLTGQAILEKVDQLFSMPKDKKSVTELTLINDSGKEKKRTLMLLEKGNERRISKFLSPAGQKGIGFLSLPDDVMYLYLPAFKKTRRIASHIKNRKFAGTDFSYEDLEVKDYAGKWNARLIETTDTVYKLKLTIKEGQTTEYGYLIMEVGKDNFYPTKTSYFDKGNNPYKLMTFNDIRQVNGYWEAQEKVMEDLKKKHKSKMRYLELAFDVGLKDSQFTEEYLKR